MAVVADVRAAAPEFADTAAFPDATIQTALDRAARHVDSVTWDVAYNDGHAYFAAHLLALSYPAASQVGPVRIYETPGAMAAGALGATRFGVEFARLREELLLGVLVP